jgi:hypothetical protein
MDNNVNELINECKKFINENENYTIILVYVYSYTTKHDLKNNCTIKKFIVNKEILLRDFILKHTNIVINENVFNYKIKDLDLKEPLVINDYKKI